MSTADGPVLPEGPSFAGWVALLAGLLSFMVTWRAPGLLWVVALAAMFWSRRRPRLPMPVLYAATLGAAVPGLWLGFVHKDAIGGFGTFLALATLVTLARARTRDEHRIPFLLAFILLMAVGQKTLEIFYLIPVTLFFVGYGLHRCGERLRDAARGDVPRRRAIFFLFVGSLILAVPIFILMPRTRMSVMAVGGRGSLSGFSGRVEFGQISSLKESTRLVMKVATETPVLLRGVTLDEYSGLRWSNTYAGVRRAAKPDEPLLVIEEDEVGASGLVVPDAADGAPEPPEVPGDGSVRVHEILLEPFDQPVLFRPSDPLAVWAPGKHIAATTQGDLIKLSHDARLEKLTYRVYSKGQRPDRAVLAAAPHEVRAGRFHEKYLQLPDSLPDIVAERAEGVTRGRATVLEKAEAIEAYLRSQFTYSMERRVQPGMDAVADLLTGDPRGHCEYFATSMAVMLRTLGVYTRCVVGFAPGAYNRYADLYSVRDADAHAWVDVWFGRDIGWVEFDPTPPNPDHQAHDAEGGNFFLWFSAGLDTLDALWQENVVNYYYNSGGPGAEQWLYRLDDFFIRTLGWHWLAQNPDALAWKAARYGGGALVVFFLLLGLRQLLRGTGLSLWELLFALLARLAAPLRAARARGGADADVEGPAARLYRGWLEAQARRGHPKAETLTPREYLDSLRARDPDEVARGEVLTRAYAAERYAEDLPEDLLAEARAAAETR